MYAEKTAEEARDEAADGESIDFTTARRDADCSHTINFGR
jgi:hypothetical protein